MAKVTIEIEATQDLLDGFVESYSKSFGWTEEIDDPDNIGETIANPVSALDFSAGPIGRHISNAVKVYSADTAARAAREASMEASDIALEGVALTVDLVE